MHIQNLLACISGNVFRVFFLRAAFYFFSPLFDKSPSDGLQSSDGPQKQNLRDSPTDGWSCRDLSYIKYLIYLMGATTCSGNALFRFWGVFFCFFFFFNLACSHNIYSTFFFFLYKNKTIPCTQVVKALIYTCNVFLKVVGFIPAMYFIKAVFYPQPNKLWAVTEE